MAAPRPRVQPSRLRSFSFAAPIGGDDTVSPGTQIPPQRSILSYNLIGAEMGLRTRLGWREWATGLGEQVRSLLTYTGSTKDGAANRLFACTQSGIWDVSASTQSPTKVMTFPTQSDDSGWGSSTVFVTAAGHFLVYCDEANGLYVYAESGATWTAGGLAGNPVTGADPTRLVHVLPWKQRLWFTERDTARAWYLDVGAVTGAAVAFNFGTRFRYGGDLRCLSSWTYDGGSGIDDALVAVSGSGDVVIYKGTDPASASTFALAGVWYVGAVPVGRRLTTESGGDLLIMSSQGILPLSRLVIGNVLYDRSQYSTFAISNLFNQLQATTSTLRGWAMRLHPQDAALMVLSPATDTPLQLAMSLVTKGWHRYRGMPRWTCAEPWGNTLFFGTDDGRVVVNGGYLDGVLLSDPDAFQPIDWSLLTAYSNLGTPQRKRLQQIRVKLLSSGGFVPVNAEARYNLDLSEAAAPYIPQGLDGAPLDAPLDALLGTPGFDFTRGAGVWDVAKWDAAVWSGSYTSQQTVFGAYGNGQDVALAIRGQSTARMTLVGADVSWDMGGFL